MTPRTLIGERPFDLLDTAEGARAVETLLGRIAYGIAAWFSGRRRGTRLVNRGRHFRHPSDSRIQRRYCCLAFGVTFLLTADAVRDETSSVTINGCGPVGDALEIRSAISRRRHTI